MAGSTGKKEEREMKSKRTSLVLGLALLLAAAGGLASLAYAQATDLSVTFGSTPYTYVCNGDGTATVTVYYTVTSVNASTAQVTWSLDGGSSNPLITIKSGNVNSNGPGMWTINGDVKTYTDSYTFTLAAGTYDFTACVGQAGSSACSAPLTLDLSSCLADAGSSCGANPFGEVPHNTNLCKANGQIEIQFTGNFGATAHLTVVDSSGNTYVDADVARAGDSCNYHYNWNPAPTDSNRNAGTGNGGAGTYTFTATGNGQTPLVWTASLECQ
jgi:hypothetical protein